MALRRVNYALLLVLSLVFYWAYREWMAFFLLALAVTLPWVSLVCSLSAMGKLQLAAQCQAAVVEKGVSTYAGTFCRCTLPPPPVKSKMQVRHSISGEKQHYKMGSTLPTGHCGRLEITVGKAWVYDYLGLFRMRLRSTQGTNLTVRPAPIAVENPPDVSRYLANSWKPKPGGGFSENHELRLYRPGDNLNQVHWKLSAKTGKLILREPMEPLRGLALLTMELRGSPDEIDHKLGQLLWMSRYLLDNDISHQIHCLTGRGIESYSVSAEAQMYEALDSILAAPMEQAGLKPNYIAASWHYSIGGDGDEA